jgi:NAD(P)-dependent dehydrogenase (short-subunit alcohol dehydrogenase family)
MTITLAKRDPKILVNAIAPGYVWTQGGKRYEHFS